MASSSDHPRRNRATKLMPPYKTTLCREYFFRSSCANGDYCSFAHGDGELRLKHHPPRLEWYKTKLCHFHHGTPPLQSCDFAHGTPANFCPHGAACWFLHDEVPVTDECPLFRAIGTCYFFGAGCPFIHTVS